MKQPRFSLLPRSFRSLPLLAFGAVLASSLSLQAAYIAGLDGVSPSSTLEAEQIAPIASLPALGWTDIVGTARYFDFGPDYDGRIINETEPYGNYTVQYRSITDVFYEAQTLYTLTFHLGYTAGNGFGVSEYSFSLGTIGAGGFTPLATTAGVRPYAGANVFDPAVLEFTTGDVVPTDPLAIQWSQTYSSAATDSSDWLGFNLVTLDATRVVPEPSTALLAALAGGLGAMSRRRRS